MAGQLNKKELELLMGSNPKNKQAFTDEQKDLLMDYLFNKYMEDMQRSKERSEDFYNQPAPTDMLGNERIEAKLPGQLNNNETNMLMNMIDKGIKDTKPEGIMTAQQYEQGGDLNYVIEMMKNETDPDKLEELKSIIREMLGTTPYMSIRQDPVRKAADGGIVSLADGGDPEDVPLKKTIKTPSTYGKRVFEDFLFDAGFVKIDPDTGKPRGSKGEFNKYLLKKGIKPSSEAGTTELNKILKKLNKPMYISLEMAQGAQGLSLAEEATGTKKGRVGAAARNDVFKNVDLIRKEANKMDFKNKEEKYNFIKKEIKKKFPAITAGTLATLAKGTALGMGLEMFMPQELQAATLYSPEDMDKMLGEMAIREKFE